jgi:hypothetical protein
MLIRILKTSTDISNTDRESKDMIKGKRGRAIAQAVSRWIPTATVHGSKPDLGMWDLWWDKVALGRFSPSTSVSLQ